MYKIYESPKHSFSFVSFAPSGSPNLNPHLRNFLNCSNSIQWSFKWGREVVWGDKWVFWGRRGQMGEKSALIATRSRKQPNVCLIEKSYSFFSQFDKSLKRCLLNIDPRL